MSESIRSTVYFDTDLHKALRLKAACTRSSVSELVNDASLDVERILIR